MATSAELVADVVSPAGVGVVRVAVVHEDEVSWSWCESMRRLREHDRVSGRRLAVEPIAVRCPTGRLSQARNLATRRFLDETDDEWLWFVDTDMGFAPDTVDRLLKSADPVERPVVGALCFTLVEQASDGMGGLRFHIGPTIYMGGRNPAGDQSFGFFGDYPRNTIMQVAGTGPACLLIHRGALEKVRAESGDRWWDHVADGQSGVLSEDLSFCTRLHAAGIPIHVDTSVKTTHHKQVHVAEADFGHPDGQTGGVAAGLAVHVDIEASLATLAANEHVREGGMLKLLEDLDRYRRVIVATRPEVIVETGTRTGASARWFAALGVDVITVDVSTGEDLKESLREDGVYAATGDSADPEIAARIARIVGGRRCMVVLDSDHSAAHVAKEIQLYGPMVSKGCHLVVEDTIFGYADEHQRAQHCPGMADAPLDAVAALLDGNPDWRRDVDTERLSPVSHHPGGFWTRCG